MALCCPRWLALLGVSVSAACSPDPCPKGSFRAAGTGLCTLESSPRDSGPSGSEGDGSDGSDGTDAGFALGDPILTVAREGTDAPGGGAGTMVEWVDATMLTDRYGLTVGVGGWAVVDSETGERIFQEDVPRAYRVDSDGQTLVATTRQGQVLRADLSDPTNPVKGRDYFMGGDAANEDIAVDGNLVLVGWTSEGGVLYDLTSERGDPVGTLPVDWAFAVGLSGDRAVVTSHTELSLWDVSDPSSPVGLDAVTLAAEGRDLDFDGVRVVVATGGAGVEVFSVQDDSLVSTGSFTVPGSAMGVALDGDHAWVSAWETVGLAYLGGEEPVVLGHEDVAQSALGIGASNGRAVVADWFFVSMLERQEGLAGPELVTQDAVWLSGTDEAVLHPVRNGGAFDLEVTVSVQGEVTVEPETLSLAPGERANLVVTPSPSMRDPFASLWLTTNDPDETEVEVRMSLPEGNIGSTHGSLALQGFTLPEGTPQAFSLDDQRGKVVLLVYFALY